MHPTLYTQQSNNVFKTYFLMALFIAVIGALGLAFSVIYDSPNILYFAIIFSLIFNFWGYWFSDKVALSIAHAKPIDENNPRFIEIKQTVENLSIAAGLPTPKLYVINDRSPNAFATGRNKTHASIAMTSGLLEIMNRSELEGVLAHELSHIGNRDILLSTIVVVLVGLISLASNFFIRSQFMFGGRDGEKGNQNAIVLIISILFIILSPIVATIIQLAISRKREFLADATGALITRYPEGLANALRKLENYNQPLKSASTATAHMYISNPFGMQAYKGLQKLFMTHPPIEERIKALIGDVA